MTLIEKISFLMKKNGLNKKTLSEQIGMPYSTIDGFFKVSYENMKLSNFRKLCDFFHVTMDSMARDYMDIEYYDPASKDFYTNENERALLIAFRKADIIDQTSIRRTLHLNDTDQKKSASVS